MNRPREERRRYERYDTEVKIYFRVSYDIKTKVEFQIVNKNKQRLLSEKHHGLSRNVSVEGMRFSSDKKLRKGEILYIGLYLPRQKEPISMIGKVRWSKMFFSRMQDKYVFDTGVKLMSVGEKSVSESIYFDEKHSVFWSIVLESVLGNFRKLMQKKIAKKCAFS